jgi:hypothetical protein
MGFGPQAGLARETNGCAGACTSLHSLLLFPPSRLTREHRVEESREPGEPVEPGEVEARLDDEPRERCLDVAEPGDAAN